jgi:hypothetical protein
MIVIIGGWAPSVAQNARATASVLIAHMLLLSPLDPPRVVPAWPASSPSAPLSLSRATIVRRGSTAANFFQQTTLADEELTA